MTKRNAMARWGVTAIGAAVVAFSVVAGLIGDDGLVRNGIEVLLPTVVGVGLVGLGEKLRRREYSSREILIVAISAIAGGALFLAMEGWMDLIEKSSPGGPPELLVAVVFVVNRISAGMMGASLLAALYIRTRRQNRELQRLNRRLKDRNQSLSTQAEKLTTQNQRLNQLAQIVSHDLRNPLNVATGHVELARETGDASHLEAVEVTLSRMETIITDMLTLVSQGQLVESKQSIDLAAIATSSWETVATGDVELDVTADGYVEADEDRCRHVFENLFRNAIEHGGSELSTVRVGKTADGFYISDDGVGIPPDDRAEIFEPGFSTTDGGSGLGMVIVQAVVEAHGWTIDVSESETGGARFDIDT